MKWKGGQIPVRETFITPLPIVTASQYLNKIGFTEMVNQHVQWDPAQCNLSPGMLARSVVLSTFTERRAALCNVSKSFESMDLEGLFGLACYEKEFSDDAIARTLDKLYEANTNALYAKMSLSCLAKFDLSINGLHSDTSSMSLTGDYAECQEDGYGGLNICQGYSKDNKPNQKQVMIGKIVTEQGIPLVSMPLDGNTADSTYNQEAVKLLAATFGKRMEETIYVADSKLINKPTLAVLQSQSVSIRFVSRCPDSFHDKIAVKIKQQAFIENRWQEQGILGEKKHCAEYHTQSYQRLIDGYPYRLIVVHTSAGRARVEKALKKSEAELQDLFATQEKRLFACEADAKKIKKELEVKVRSSYHQVKWTIEKEETEQRPRGNPGKDPKPLVLKTTWKVRGSIQGLVEDKVEKLRQKDCPHHEPQGTGYE